MEILTGAVIISLLHALIPNHWLPIIAIGRQHKWSINEVTQITFITALAHILSTVIIGVILGSVGHKLAHNIEHLTHTIAPIILIIMGLVYIYRHYKHKHFHLHGSPVFGTTKRSIIITLSIAMFMSPCMEIEALFLMAGTKSMALLASISLVYAVATLVGMLILVRFAYKGLLKFDSHKLEHNAGIITGAILILTGLSSFFYH